MPSVHSSVGSEAVQMAGLAGTRGPELTIGGDVCEISVKESRISKAFEEFQRLCDEYSKYLKDEEDMEECLVYFQEGERRFSEVKERITLWCQSRVQSRSEEHHHVGSASQVNSEYSRYSSSKQSSSSRRSSKMTTEGRRLNNQAQLASLQAEVSFLHQHKLIASEELRRNRMKEKLKLETQMAKISAEEKVFTDFETRSQISTEDKPFSVPHVSTSIPPLKKTDESVAHQLESVVAKYEAEPGTRVNPQTDAIQDFQMNPHATPWERSPQPDYSLKKDKSAAPVADVEYLQSMKKRYVTEPKKMLSRAANFSIGAQEMSNYTIKCFNCGESLRLVNCEKFKLLNGEQQFKLIRAKKLCDNCLSNKHYSLGCKKNKECTVPGCEVRRKHLTTIHDALKESKRKCREQLSKEKTNNDVQSQESAARSQFFAAFCSDHLLNRLGIDGKRFQMQLATIDGVNMWYETTINHLQVMDMHERVCIDVAKVFSTKTLNVSKTAIATDEDLMKLPSMRDIGLPDVLQGEEVNLLFGVDVPEASQPLEIRKSEDGGLFAVKSKRLLNDPVLKQKYVGFIDDLMVKEYTRRIPVEDALSEIALGYRLFVKKAVISSALILKSSSLEQMRRTRRNCEYGMESLHSLGCEEL
eukprot:gene17196-18926_t